MEHMIVVKVFTFTALICLLTTEMAGADQTDAGPGHDAHRHMHRRDIDQRFLDHIAKRRKSLSPPPPVETRLVKERDPMLDPGEADVVLIVNTYHHIGSRVPYFDALRESMPPGHSPGLHRKRLGTAFGPEIRAANK